MATGSVIDPYGNFNFLVEIDGITRAAFQRGERLRLDHRRHRAPRGRREHHACASCPGMTKYSNIVLKWGMTDDRELYDWHRRRRRRATSQRKNGSIVLLDRKGNEVARWNFVDAWPTKWDGPDLNAESNDVAIETLELAHEGVERA